MSEDNAPIIIIRKKRGDGEEEHHGGVWKLAFADFMTAMMAFFLVMWLINSTTKETKAVIVQYFNPVQLIDANPAHKGLRDPKQTGQGKSQQKTHAPDVSTEETKEAALHKEPMKALDEIAKRETAPPQAAATAPAIQRDPFDRAPGAAAEHGAPNSKAAASLKAELAKIAASEAHAPRIDVKQVDGGVLISLTDDANFSMFAVGSIEPKPQLVRIIGEIGKVLATRRGEIELRGHTDGRSYAGKHYDNWRLSSDRATIVNYMLQRGGLAPDRIGKIVGYADRRLRTPKDPLGAGNRRIEILLQGGDQ